MIDRRFPLSRRAVLAAAAGLGLAATPAAAKRRKEAQAKKGEEAARETAPTGTPLPIPRLVDLVDGETFELVAEATTHAFRKDAPVAAIGYGGTYLGPALRLTRGTTPKIRLVNRLVRPTNLHWHGLLVAGRFDGATSPGIARDAIWETELAVDQPAATLWYHAHVHGRTARDVHDGLAGLLLVEDGTAARLGLPSTWGVDDIPLVLQDRRFDEAGRPLYDDTPASIEHGFHGPTMIVNGVTDAVARVPQRLVRLRLLNAASARDFRLAFEDQRGFRLIATDAGFLAEPAELSLLVLSPGERAEILVDFTEGGGTLLTATDEHEHRSGAQIANLPDVIDRPAKIVVFETVKDKEASATPPARLADLPPLPRTTGDLTRRRFELRVRPNLAAHDLHGAGHGSMTHGTSALDGTAAAPEPPLRLTINDRTYAPGRIDDRVRLGTTEVWEIVTPDMAHPFHIHGAQFRVLSEDGDTPKVWNRGLKDTVRVENSVELLVYFDRPAEAAAPFLYHCHLLEHEDGGMMGTFTVE